MKLMCGALLSSAQQGEELAKALMQCAWEVQNNAAALSGGGAALWQERARANQLAGTLQTVSTRLQNHAALLREIAGMYAKAEKELCQRVVVLPGSYGGVGSGSGVRSPAPVPDASTTAAGSGLSPEVRALLLGAGILPQTIDAWEKAGLSLNRKEAEAYLPMLEQLAQKEAAPETIQDFATRFARETGGALPTAGAFQEMGLGEQARLVGQAAGILLACYPNLSMEMNQRLEVPAGPGLNAYYEVSGNGKASSGSALKVSQVLDAHKQQLKEGISISKDGAAIQYSKDGRSISCKTDAGTWKYDEKSVSWTAGGSISKERSFEVAVKINLQTGAASCEERLTTQVGAAAITTTLGLEANPGDGAGSLRPYPGLERSRAVRQQVQAVEALLIEGMLPQMAGTAEVLEEMLGVPALQSGGLH